MSIFGSFSKAACANCSTAGANTQYVDAQDGLHVLKSGDTMTGELTMSSNRIVGLGAPVDPTNASTATFVLETAGTLKAGVVSRDGTPSATMPTELDMGANQVVSVGDPTGPQDAATKNYVDAQGEQHVLKAGDTMTGDLAMIGNLVSGLPTTYRPLYSGDEATSWGQTVGLVSDAVNILVEKGGGDTMTGPLTMSANKVTAVAKPTSPYDAATKSYVDTWDGLRVLKAGDTMTGPLSMSANKISAVANPKSPQDAATKAYVDMVGARVFINARRAQSNNKLTVDLSAGTHTPLGPLFPYPSGMSSTAWNPVAGLFTAFADGVYAVAANWRIKSDTAGASLGNVYTSVNGSTDYGMNTSQVYIRYEWPGDRTSWHSWGLYGCVRLSTGETVGITSSYGTGSWTFHTSASMQVCRVSQ